MKELAFTNTFISNPYLVYFDKDGSVNEIFDQWQKILPRKMIESILEYAQWYLENYPTDDHVDLENMKIERAHDKREQEFRKEQDIKTAHEKENRDRRDVYLIRDIYRGCHKIGVAKNAETRFTQLKTANAGIELVAFFVGVAQDERILHRHFTGQGKRIDGEWFSLEKSDIEHIEKYFNK